MKKTILLLNLIIIIGFLFSCEISNDDSNNMTTISGQILHEGKGVPGVDVSVKDQKTETNFNGDYSILVPKNESITIKISKPGFIEYSEVIDNTSGEIRKEINLYKYLTSISGHVICEVNLLRE